MTRLADQTRALAIALVMTATPCIVSAQIGAPADNTWSPIGPEGGTILSLARDPLDDRHIVVGTYFGGLYESTDAGFTWKPLLSQFSHVPIFSLAFDPVRSGTIYAGTFEGGLYKTSDGGRTWAARNDGLAGVNVAAIAVDPFDPARVIAATSDRGAFLSQSGAASWSPVANDQPILAKAVAFDPQQQGVIYLGTLGSGVFRSTDGGGTWHALNEGLSSASALAFTFDAIDPRRLYLATSDGVFARQTGTDSWRPMTTGLPEAEVTQVVSHPVVPGLLFAITPVGLYFTFGPPESFTGWGMAALLSGRLMTTDRAGLTMHLAATHGGLLVTTDFGRTWAGATHGMQNVFVGALAAVAGGGQVSLYAGTDGVRVTNDGRVWRSGNLGLGVFEITPHPGDPSTLFAGLERDGVWKTTDAGRTWQPSANGVLPTQVHAIAQSSAWPHPLYAGTSSGLFISWNGGQSWNAVPTGNIPIVLSIAADPVRPVTFFGYAAGTVGKTIDEGRSVLPVSTGLPNENIVALKAVAWDKVYAVTSGGELYATVDDGANWLPWRNGVTFDALAIDAHPTDAWIVYLGTRGGGVYKSESGGIAWAPRNAGLGSSIITAIAVDPAHPDTVYAGGIGEIYKSTDGAQRWSAAGSGLPAALVTGIVVDATDSQIVYVSLQDQGVYRSTNGGGTWSAANSGLPTSGPSPVAIDRFDHTRLYVGTRLRGVYGSTDSGAAWTPRTTGISLFVRALALDPTAPDTMFAGSLGGGVFKTTDGARSWENVGLQDQNIFKLAVDPLQPSRIYAATAQGVSRSVDGGRTWTAAGQRFAYVNALAVDPGDRRVVYAAGSGGRLARSPDGGLTWEPRNTGLPEDTIRALAVDGPRRIVYASAGANGFFRTLDAGMSWVRLAHQQTGAELVNALAVDAISGTVYAATNDRGVFRSTTWGEQWAPANTGLSSLRLSHVAVDPATSGVVYAATFDRGIFKTINGGADWHWTGYGLASGVVLSVTPDPHTPAVVYAATDAGVFRSTDGGSTWHRSGLDGLTVTHVVADSVTPARLYAAAKGSGLFHSTDGGVTWIQAAADLPSLDIRALGAGPGGHAYAATLGGGVVRSSDGGATWRGGTHPWTAEPAVLSIAVDPRNAGTVYAGTGGVGVLKSNDGGVDWAPVNNGLDSQFVLALTVDRQDPNTVYAGTVNGGVYVTNDGGNTWRAVSGGLFNQVITSLAIDPVDHRVVYAGTEGGGVFVARIPPAQACSFTVTPSTLVVAPAGGAQHLQITAAAPCEWTARSITDWIIVSSSPRGVGSGVIDLWVGPNGGADVRSGHLIVAGRPVLVSQHAASQSHLVTVTKSGRGTGTVASEPSGIFCADDCVESFLHGSSVILRAYPAAGSMFAGWSGDSGCGTGTLTVAAPLACVARFEVAGDADGDTLPDDWERQTGLDHLAGAGADGPDGDPDGDGVTNAGEHAAGTHPRGFFTRYFAEGQADDLFTTEFALLNPSASTAHVLLRFMSADGAAAPRFVALGPRTHGRVSIAYGDGVAAEFGTVIESDAEIAIERALLWGTAEDGSTAEAAVQAPSQIWHFPGAIAGGGFEHRYAVLNPGAEPASLEVTFHRPAPLAPVVRSYTVPAGSRATIRVGAGDAELADAWTTIVSNKPVVAEWTLFKASAGAAPVAGLTAAGTTASNDWVIGEVPTGGVFDTFIFVANPASTVSEVTATFALVSGATVDKPFTVAPQGRVSLNVEQQWPELAELTASASLHVTNGVPVVVESATWWPGQSTTWYAASGSAGISRAGTRWAVAGSEIGGAHFSQGALLITNTSARDASALVTLMFEDGTTVERTIAVSAQRRAVIDLAAEFPEASWRRFGAVVESVGPDAAPVVVEHGVYLNTNGQSWGAGRRTAATRLTP